jgi:hypothetical protein
MERGIFEKWIIAFNEEMKGMGKTAWLLLDNSSTHGIPAGCTGKIWEVDGLRERAKLTLLPFYSLCLLLTPILMLQGRQGRNKVPVPLCLPVFHFSEITIFSEHFHTDGPVH